MHLPIHHPGHGLDPGLLRNLVSRAVDHLVVGEWVVEVDVVFAVRYAVGSACGAAGVVICKRNGSKSEEGEKETEGKVEGLHDGCGG